MSNVHLTKLLPLLWGNSFPSSTSVLFACLILLAHCFKVFPALFLSTLRAPGKEEEKPWHLSLCSCTKIVTYTVMGLLYFRGWSWPQLGGTCSVATKSVWPWVTCGTSKLQFFYESYRISTYLRTNVLKHRIHVKIQIPGPPFRIWLRGCARDSYCSLKRQVPFGKGAEVTCATTLPNPIRAGLWPSKFPLPLPGDPANHACHLHIYKMETAWIPESLLGREMSYSQDSW